MPAGEAFGPESGGGADEFALKPENLSTAEFRRVSVGGYAREDVDAFAERCADHIARLQRQVRYLKGTAEEQSRRIAELTARDRAAIEAELDALEAQRDALRQELSELLERHRRLLDETDPAAAGAPGEAPAQTKPGTQRAKPQTGEPAKAAPPKTEARAKLRRKRRRRESARGPF